MSRSMFRISDGKGFVLELENGYAVSVQFGPGNYADHYRRRIGLDEVDCGREGSRTAECAVINPDGELIEHPGSHGDTVSGRNAAEQVLALLNWAASLGVPKIDKEASGRVARSLDFNLGVEE